MKESFPSVKDCLNSLEFCPICGKRNNVSLEFHNLQQYFFTQLDNHYLKIRTPGTQELFAISLDTNTVAHNRLEPNSEPYIHLSCKGFHFNVMYDLIECEGVLNLKVNRLSFFIRDNKKQFIYNILSDYDKNQTTINLSDNKSIFQEFKQKIINFRDFDKNSVIKRIRALSLLY